MCVCIYIYIITHTHTHTYTYTYIIYIYIHIHYIYLSYLCVCRLTYIPWCHYVWWFTSFVFPKFPSVTSCTLEDTGSMITVTTKQQILRESSLGFHKIALYGFIVFYKWDFSLTILDGIWLSWDITYITAIQMGFNGICKCTFCWYHPAIAACVGAQFRRLTVVPPCSWRCNLASQVYGGDL